MKKQLVVFLLAALPLVAVEAFSQPTHPATTLVMRGTIQKYDPSLKILTFSTSNGTMQFTMTPAARIRQGWNRIDASALERYSGFHAAVRYLESGAERTVESVHVFGRNQKWR
jgi:hypothetical protein